MSATNPFRVSDLIAKYGWKIMPYLSNLGPLLLAEAQVLFVDSGHTDATDADDTEHGHSFEKPLATIDYAIDLCTAEERSVILVAPGHVETLAAATIDFDVSDITVIGIGEGTNRPKVVFGNAVSSIDIGANNIHLINLRFVPSITDVLIGVDIETGKTGTILENCEFAEGDDIAVDEFIIGLALKATCTDTRVKNCIFRTGIAADGALAAIQLTGISDNVVIEKSRFIGNWGTAGIYNDSGVCTDLLIDDCTMKVADGLPGISVVATTTGIIRNVCIESTGLAVDSMIVAAAMAWFNNQGVTTDGSAAEIIGGGEVNAALAAHGLDHLVTLADGATVRPASVVEDSILAKLMGSPDPATIATYDNTKHSLEAIGDDTDAIIEDIAAAVPTTPAAGSLQDALNKDRTGTNTFASSDDSLEAISDRLSVTESAIQAVRGNSSATFYVNNETGADGNDGLTWATAKDTITAGIALANAIDPGCCTIYVAGVGYTEDQITITANRLKLIAVSASKEMPLWQNNSPTVGSHLLIQASQVEVFGFRFHHSASSTTPSIILDGGNLGNAAYIHNNYFTSSGSSSGSAGVEMLHSGYDHDISDNEFFNLQGSGNQSGAIYQTGQSNMPVGCTIKNNKFFNCVTAISFPGSFCSIIGNYISGFSQDDSEKTVTYVHLLHPNAESDNKGDSVLIGGNIVAGNYFADHFSWEIHSGNGYWFSDTDAVSGNFCKDGVMGRGGPSAEGADAADVQLVPGKRYSMSKALTGGWAATAHDLFDILGGPIRVISLTGTVTAAIKNTQMDLSLVAAVTTPSGSIDIASLIDCDNDDPGTILTLNATFGSALVELTNGVGANGGDFIMPIGTINMTSGHVDDAGGAIRWDMEFIPLVPGVSVTPA